MTRLWTTDISIRTCLNLLQQHNQTLPTLSPALEHYLRVEKIPEELVWIKTEPGLWFPEPVALKFTHRQELNLLGDHQRDPKLTGHLGKVREICHLNPAVCPPVDGSLHYMSMTVSTPALAGMRLHPDGFTSLLLGVTTPGIQEGRGEGENRLGGYLTGTDMNLEEIGDTCHRSGLPH